MIIDDNCQGNQQMWKFQDTLVSFLTLWDHSDSSTAEFCTSLKDMILRFAFFRDWIEGGIPIAYWISSFYFPQAENPQKLVGTDSLAYCKCIWWMWTDVNGIAKLANFILHRHTCRLNVPRSDHKSLQQCTNRCLQPALAFTSGVVLTCTLPLCRTSLGRCNEYLEVSWNRGTPKSSIYRWDFP